MRLLTPDGGYIALAEATGRPELVQVAAMRESDIHALFPKARVRHTPLMPQPYRAAVPRKLVARCLSDLAMKVNYPLDVTHNSGPAFWQEFDALARRVIGALLGMLPRTPRVLTARPQ